MATKRVRTTTSLSTFLTCRRKFELRHIQRLRPIHPPSWSRFGSAFHRFDEAYHAGESVEAALTLARPVFFGDNPEDTQVDKWDDFCTICHGYADAYPILSDRDPKGCPFTRERNTGLVFRSELQETPFKVPVFTPKGRCSAQAEYSGVFDAIVEDASGDLWVFETKTVANLTEGFFDKLAIDRQALRYVYAARQIFGPRVKGLIYNAVSKTAPRPPGRRQDGWMSTAAVVSSPMLVEEVLATCRREFLERQGESSVESLLTGGDIALAVAYLAHDLREEMASWWATLEGRAKAEPAATGEKLLKLIAKAQQDQQKYRQILEANAKRLLISRRVRLVTDEELEEVQWELYQLDRDIHLAEQEGHFYPNDRSCDAMGGCEFREYCLKRNAQAYEVAANRHVELPEDGFLTPTNPRPVKSKLTALTELLREDDAAGLE
jgi:hypothetical protein